MNIFTTRKRQQSKQMLGVINLKRKATKSMGPTFTVINVCIDPLSEAAKVDNKKSF